MKELQSKIRNKQSYISDNFSVLTLISSIIILIPLKKENPFSGNLTLSLLGIFFTVSFFIFSLLFRYRAIKTNNLLKNKKILIRWVLKGNLLNNYITFQKKEFQKKNKPIIWGSIIIFLVINILSLFIIISESFTQLIQITSLITIIIFSVSLFYSFYTFRKNLKGDKQILIGEKFIYFNGFFHNWDYQKSGLSKIEKIEKPFNGLIIAYYFTDLIWKHSHEEKIPVPDNYNLDLLIAQLKRANNKK